MSKDLESLLRTHCAPLTLYGFFVIPIVGIQHAKGSESLKYGTWAKAAREPDNPYDANAIRVDTVNGLKIGYVPRQHAKTIKRVFDDLEGIQVECMILDTPDTYEVKSVFCFYGEEAKQESLRTQLQNTVYGLRQL